MEAKALPTSERLDREAYASRMLHSSTNNVWLLPIIIETAIGIHPA